MAVPLLLLILVGSGWSWYWYYALDIAKAQFAKLKTGDITVNCARETWAGFPFRFTVVCDDADFRIGTGKATASGKTNQLTATVRAYDPNHVIAEFGPPFSLNFTMSVQQDGLTLPDTVTLNSETSAVRAGVLMSGRTFRQVSIRAQDWRGSVTATGAGKPMEKARTTADLLAVHWAPARPDASDTAPVLSMQVEKLAYSGAFGASHGMQDLTIEKAGFQTAFINTEISTRLASLSGIRSWQAAGGEIKIAHFDFTKGAQEAEGSGTVRLDSEGRLEGRIDLLVKGMDDALRGLVDAGRLSSTQAALASTAIGLLSQTENKAKPGWTGVPVRATKGRIYFGPFKATTIKPLFCSSASIRLSRRIRDQSITNTGNSSTTVPVNQFFSSTDGISSFPSRPEACEIQHM